MSVSLTQNEQQYAPSVLRFEYADATAVRIERPSAGEQTVSVESLDSLIFHASLVTLVMLAGYVMRTPYAACANGISQHTRITAPFLHSL